ncbi:MAG: DUF91 domain-containing protein [Chloroflexi bacterium]|nr:DUF91 domain-containing protein [Chloroflexota bacterium]
MPQDIRLWGITSNDALKEISRSRLNLEERIENWLESDISILSNDLLVIGRQVKTDFEGKIDLLCLDYTGDLVIVELKRDKTPREITAQALEYASWVKDLSNESIRDIVAEHSGSKVSLEDAYKQRFGEEELPEVLNAQHKILIVASEIDESSERIINYLSSTYGVPINAATFRYYEDSDGREFLARTFLIEPSEVESKTQISSKRKPNLTHEDLETIAIDNGVGDLYMRLVENSEVLFDQRNPTRSTLAFIGIIEGSRNVIFSLIPGESSQLKGIRFALYIERLMNYLGVEKQIIEAILPKDTEEAIPYKNAPITKCGYFTNNEEINRFIEGLSKAKKK